MSAGWSEAASVAQLIAAVATLALAGFTGWLAKRTHDLAVEAQTATRAAGRQADATQALAEEAQRDRELLWQPILSAKREAVTTSADSYIEHDVTISNVGSGPAINVIYAGRKGDDTAWCFIRGIQVRGGGDYRIPSTGTASEALQARLFAAPAGETGRPLRVLICSDIFGNRYRFTDDERIEVSRHGDHAPPDWALVWRFGSERLPG